MEAIHAIHTRRSIRKFKKTPVDDETLEEIIAAGMMAPSAGNAQPWHFIVLKDKALFTKISDHCLFAAAVAAAPLAILICGDPEHEQCEGFWDQSCAAATQNMLLAAHAKGLGSVWIGIHPRPKRITDIRSLVDMPEKIVPFALLPIGYPAEDIGMEVRFDPAQIHIGKW